MKSDNGLSILRIGVIVSLAIFLILGGWLWFTANFEKEAYQVEVRDKSEKGTRKGTYSGAKEYLRATGHKVIRGEGNAFFFAPSFAAELSYSTLILTSYPKGARNEIEKRLLAWVEKGGHLIVSIDTFFENTRSGKKGGEKEAAKANFLMERVGVQLEKERIADDVGKEKVDKFVPIQLNTYPVTLCIPSYFRRNFVDGRGDAIFKIERGGREGAWALQYKLGEGKITFLRTARLWNNRYLCEGDNAFFLSFLVEREGDKKRLVSLWSEEPVENGSRGGVFWQWNWQAFSYTILSLVLLFFIILWSFQVRLSPPVPLSDRSHRSLFAHLDGVGKFHWRIDGAARLFAKNREFVAMQGSKYGRKGRKRMKKREEEVLQKRCRNEQDFIAATKVLQKIYNRAS